ncbi:MAG: hypothetical protein ACXWJM_05190 [Ramlibacter sp.]
MKAEHRTRFTQAVRWSAVILAGIGYSVLEHLVAAAATPSLFGALVAITPLTALACILAWRSPRRPVMLALCLAAFAAMYLMSDWLLAHYGWVFLLQHTGIYALLCFAFGRTLQAGHRPLVTGLAQLVHDTMTPALVRYTRSVTWAWTIYFGATSALSLLLFWLAPIAVWSAFAYLLSPVLLVLMFTAEYAVRFLVLPAADRAGPLEAIRAYRRSSASGGAHRP